MKVVMFVLSLLVFICSVVMLYGAVIKESPMYYTGVIVMVLICGLSFILTRISYREMRD